MIGLGPIARYGAAYTLRRAVQGATANEWDGDGAETVTYWNCVARERPYKPGEVKGGLQEGDALLVVDGSTISVVPQRGDRIALGVHSSDAGAAWQHVTDVQIPLVAGAAKVYRLRVRA